MAKREASFDEGSLFARCGETGRLIASHDWASTPLGRLKGWPAQLKTTVGIMLRSPVPLVLLWGEQGVMLYNDAYSVFAGGRHPQLLGSNVREGWPEVADFNDNVMRVGLAGGTLHYSDQELTLYRHGRAEQVWMNLDYSPVPDETGAPAGVLCILNETTERVLAERGQQEERRRLEDSEARLRALTDNSPVALVYQLETSRDLTERRYTYVSANCEALTGVSAQQALADPMALVDRIDPAEWPRILAAEQAAAQGLELLDIEISARGRNGQPIRAHLFARPREMEDGRLIWDGLFLDVTARRLAEAASQESDRRLATALATARLGGFEWDLGTDAVRLDARAREIFGFNEDEGRTASEVFARIDPLEFPRVHAEALASQEKLSRLEIEYRINLPEGGQRTIASISDAIPGPDGKAEKLIGVFGDITDRKRIEAALLASEARFEAIANSIEQMIWATRPDGYHDYYNQRWYDYTGVPQGSTDVEAWKNMFHPEDQERALQVWRHSLETGEPYHIEYMLRHRSGQYRWVLGRAQCVRDPVNGKITRWFGTCTDIQDIVEAREVLARSREELEQEVARRTEDRDRIWRLSTDVILVAGIDGGIRAVNPAWTSLLGWRDEELAGRSFLDLVHPDDRSGTLDQVAHLQQGERVLRFENRYRAKDGSYRWLSWMAVPEGGLIHAVGRDVTADKEQREALRLAEDALRQAQKMEAVGQLTGGVAHDFNNLLTIIRSSVDFLRHPDLAEERRRRYMDAISDTVDRAARLTSQLLAFARRQTLKPEVFDVCERIRAVTDMLRTIVGARVHIIAELACAKCFIEADVTQFDTALVNLAVNARDAMEGEGRLLVRVDPSAGMPAIRGHAGSTGQFVAISISDTGVGIPADKIGQIFEPFFTTKEIGKGTGLGLSQVYGFAKQSGGDVEVDSEVGEGTTFTLYLPRREEHETAPRGADSGSAQLRADAKGCRVLLVEDNEDVGRFSTQVLRDLGFETTWAKNGREALKLVDDNESRFDVVFTDVVMPGMNGLDLALKIRQRFPDLPVVLTSGYSHVLAEEGRHGFELLQKPYAAADVSRVLGRVRRL